MPIQNSKMTSTFYVGNEKKRMNEFALKTGNK